MDTNYLLVVFSLSLSPSLTISRDAVNRFSGPVSYDSNQPPPPQQRYRNNPYNNRGGGGGGGRRGGGGDGNYQQQPNRFYHDYGNHNKGDVRNRLGPLKHQQTS